MEAGLEVNGEKIKYMLIPHHHNAKQTLNIKKSNKLFENMEKFKYIKTRVTPQNQPTD
jgi:hypothetical protein